MFSECLLICMKCASSQRAHVSPREWFSFGIKSRQQASQQWQLCHRRRSNCCAPYLTRRPRGRRSGLFTRMASWRSAILRFRRSGGLGLSRVEADYSNLPKGQVGGETGPDRESLKNPLPTNLQHRRGAQPEVRPRHGSLGLR